jgi:hypothetical protein
MIGLELGEAIRTKFSVKMTPATPVNSDTLGGVG